MSILQSTLWNNTVQNWLLAVGLALLASLVLRLVMGFTTSRLARLAERTANYLDDAVISALQRTSKLTYLAAGVALARPLLDISPGSVGLLNKTLLAVLLIQIGRWATHATRIWLQHYRERQLESDRSTATAVGTISFVVQTATWSMVLLVILSNLGVNITALVTGLGIGGIAVALALQNVFSDLFASLSIVFDRPFVIGDFIIVGEHLGSVENVGLKTTRLRSLSGEQLVFSNSDLLASRVRNFGRMAERRVVFNIGVTYDTEQDQLETIPAIIREAVEAQDKVRFDRSHFARFGDFALLFESVYYVLDPDYNRYMDIQQAINLSIRRAFVTQGISFAYPTQTLLVHHQDGAPRTEPSAI